LPLPLLPALLFTALTAVQAAVPGLSKIASKTDLDSVIAATPDATLKQALTDNTTAILAAAERHPHVEAVVRTIGSAPGSFTKINTTPEALKNAAGGDLAIFDTLTMVSTSIQNGKAHVYRGTKDDPYDAAFIEHLGYIPALESVKIVATKIDDSWLPPLLKLKNLKSLSIEGTARGLPGNPALGDPSLARLKALTECPMLTSLELAYFGQATDAGLEQLAGLKNLESFTFRGSPVKGHGFAKFEGWTKLKRINFHSNNLDDEGLGYVCEKFPNLEFIKLWHSKLITDASADHLKKLKKLTGMEISCAKATSGLVRHLPELPVEYVALEYGVNTPASDAIDTVKSIPTLRRLSIDGKTFTDSDLAILASITQVQELSLSAVELTDARLVLLQACAHLKTLTLVRYGKAYSDETQAKVKALLPKVDVKFVQ
ncbi:MAG: hypothetical protein DVB28_001239, partial [Verrucomicrobia bacterium]